MVIGPEPDSAYRLAALAQGAGAWISRDRVGEELGPEMRRMLGCIHDPCPPGDRPVHTDGVHGDSHPSAVTLNRGGRSVPTGVRSARGWQRALSRG